MTAFVAQVAKRLAPRVVASALTVSAAAGCQAHTDQYGRTVMSTPTLGQSLGLSPNRAGTVSLTQVVGSVQDQRTIAGKTVQVISSATGHIVAVDGRVVVRDTDDDQVRIQGIYQGGGHTYVLVAEQSGGIACPSMYQAIDLTRSTPAVSPQFGNCNEMPHGSVIGGALRVSVAAFQGTFPGARLVPGRTYVFRDGHLS